LLGLPIRIDMDGTELFQSVLAPGESLLWTGQRAGAVRDTIVGLLIPVIMTVGLIRVFAKVSGYWTGPLPLYLRLEFGLIVALLVLPWILAWRQFRRAKDTAYAVTERRLMVAAGPEREKIREVSLQAVDRVRIRNDRRGRGLYFGLRGKPENVVWAGSGWRVEDPQAVQKMVEEARDAARLSAKTEG
jgi:hypothetical protein